MVSKRTIGGGTRTETSDPHLVDRAVAIREHLGIGEDVRVEALSPLEFLELQERQCEARVEEATKAYDLAFDALVTAQRFLLDARHALVAARMRAWAEEDKK